MIPSRKYAYTDIILGLVLMASLVANVYLLREVRRARENVANVSLAAMTAAPEKASEILVATLKAVR